MRNISSVLLAVLVLIVLTFGSFAQQQKVVYSINCGGSAFQEGGKQWLSDTGFVTKGKKTLYSPRPVKDSSNSKVYLSERWCTDCTTAANALTYEFNVATDGNYAVKCYFAEFYEPVFGEGLRQFNVLINGNNVEQIDIFDQVGAAAALVKTYNVTVTGKKLTVGFQSVTENAKISGIEVIYYQPGNPTTNPPPGGNPPPSNPPPGNPPPGNPPPSGPSDPSYVPPAEVAVHRINCGADQDYTDKRGQVWAKDRDYYGATNVDRWTLPFKFIYASFPEVQQNFVENTDSDADAVLYTNERWSSGNWGYKLQVPKGKFLVRLYFAEWYHGNFELFDWEYRTKGLRGIGVRVFSVQANGQTVIPKVDVFQAVGPFAAMRREFWVDMPNAGVLDIQFTKIAESPMCNALEVIAEANVVPRQRLPAGRKQGLLVHYYDYNPGYSRELGRPETVESPMMIMPKFQNEITFVEIADYFNNPATIGNFRNTPYQIQFAAKVMGYLRVPAADKYRITLESNDGSNMRICDPDGLTWEKGHCELIGNDGNHQNLQVTREFEFKKAGFYRVEIDYFQGHVLTCLRLYWMRSAEFADFQQYYYVGHAINEDYFSYDPSEVQPVVTGPNPNGGPTNGGTPVTLNGVGFSQNTANTYVREYHPCLPAPGYKQIKANVVSDTQIRFTTEAACYGMGSIGVVILNAAGEVVKQTNNVQYFFN